MAGRGFYVGIDIDDNYAVASFYDDSMKEPSTVSIKPGTEIFQIPLWIGKKKGSDQWFINEEAGADKKELLIVDKLLERALNQEEVVLEEETYYARDLLVLYLKKLLGYISGPYGAVVIDALAFSVEHLGAQLAKLLMTVGEQLQVKKEQLVLLDRKSAFYYFALSQQRELWLHDVHLYDYREKEVKVFQLKRNLNAIPQIVTIEEQNFIIEDTGKDENFYQILEQMMRGQIISSVYLIGDGFDGGWMKQSLAYMCRGRRAFLGKNLYAKGSCYALIVIKGKMPWPYTYIGDYEMKVNISLAVRNRGKKEFYTLLSAGDTWYEACGECELILDQTKEISIWIQTPDSKTANVEKLTLSDLPERKNRTTRIHMKVKPLSDKQVKVEIKDMGFGEIAKPEDKHWEYIMSV